MELQKNIKEMTKESLRKELTDWRREFVKLRTKKYPYNDDFYLQTYNEYNAIRSLAYKVIAEIRRRGASRSCEQRISSFVNEELKVAKIIDRNTGLFD